jgi:hypothetical protein
MNLVVFNKTGCCNKTLKLSSFANCFELQLKNQAIFLSKKVIHVFLQQHDNDLMPFYGFRPIRFFTPTKERKQDTYCIGLPKLYPQIARGMGVREHR